MIVCIHGAGDGPEQWAPLGSDVFAFAAPTALDVDYRPSAIAELLGDSFTGSAALVGFSWGASIAARFALLYPERVEALVLIEGGHVDFADVPEIEPPADGLGLALYTGLVAEPNAQTWSALQSADYPILLVASAMSEKFAAAVPRAEIVPGRGHEIPYDVVSGWLDRR